jgi:translation elongation factor EF-Tu-like GTPase
VSGFLEAIVTLLPADAGGRVRPIAPRDGNYCPSVRIALQDAAIPIRVIEGPPWIAPGEDGRVVVEIEAEHAGFAAGVELELVEGQRVVGILTVVRLWREAS